MPSSENIRRMVAPLSKHLDAARRQQFTGREEELKQFAEALAATPWPFHVLHVQGPGGVGKTALLREFRHLCEEEAVPVYYLDARNLEPTVSDLMDGLTRATGRALPNRTLMPLAQEEERFVLMIDTFEVLQPLDRWMREDFLPQLPSNVLLVLAGRHPRSPGWRSDPGLRQLTCAMPLRNLSRSESRKYLERRSVPADQHEDVLAFTHGHPLALSLVADAFDQQPDFVFEPAASPDLVGALLKRFVREVPTSEHRVVLAASAMARRTTEPLLAAMLDREDAHDLFTWMRTLSFMETGRRGLFPHDLAREVLEADLRWRDPERYKTLHQHARRYYTAQLQRERDQDHERTLSDYLFLMRHNPVVKPFFRRLEAQWEQREQYVKDQPTSSDWPVLRQMVVRHEGEAAAALFDHWRDEQPQRVQLFRNEAGEPVGFLWPLTLNGDVAPDQEQDPALRTARQYLAQEAPLRPGETAMLFRFWMDQEHYQDISPVQSLIFVETVRHYLTASRPAFSFLPCADPDFWHLALAYADVQRLPDADFEVDGRSFGMFGHDWRVRPPAVWLELLAERSVADRSSEAMRPEPTAMVLVLSESDFAEAVKDALRSYAHPEGLHDNPLLHARLVVEEAGREAEPDERIDVLRNQLSEAADALESAPREAKFYRALQATYLDPAPTQERAAEQLDLPFSTFRRHLRRGVEHVTEALWRRETGS